MSTWLDRLEQHGEKVTKEKKKRLSPRPVVHEVYVTVRHSSGADPGQIDVGHFIVEDGMVKLTNQNGEPLKDGPREHELGDSDPKVVARILLRQKGSDFNRPLHYPPSRIV